MNHLSLIIQREYLTKVRNKSFIIMTFLTPLIMVALIALVAYLTSLNNEKVREVVVIDQSGQFSSTEAQVQTLTPQSFPFTSRTMPDTQHGVGGSMLHTVNQTTAAPTEWGTTEHFTTGA